MQKRSRPCRRPAGRLLATIAFVLGLLSLQLGQFSHSLFVKHVVCEHGDLVHVAASHGREHDVSGAATPRSRWVETSLRAASKESAGHDHCGSDAVRAGVPELGAVIVSDRSLGGVSLESAWVLPEQRPIAVLWLAPKSSPPRT